MEKPLKIIVVLIVTVLCCTEVVFGQSIRGKLLDYDSREGIPYANIIICDSSDIVLMVETTKEDGIFELIVPNQLYSINFWYPSGYGELLIVNVDENLRESINFGDLYLVKTPSKLDVQFKEVNTKKEIRKQNRIVKAYNRKIKRCRKIIIVRPEGDYLMKPTHKKFPESKKLRLIYEVDLKELIRITKANTGV